MDLTTPTVAQPAATAARVDTAVNDARETALSDFNGFLKLLTAQLKHQDPLAPLDSTQFVEQLASFSAVEQQVGTNEKLTRLIDQGVSDELSKLGGWIGQNVDAESALFNFGSEPITAPVPLDADAASVEARITNEAGDEIARIPLAKGQTSFEWSGELANGRTAASGDYGVAFSYAYDERSDRLVNAGATGQIVEARIDDNGPRLTLDTGAVIRPSDVNTLRASTVTEDAADS